jgi:PST family polysaccharide transporter
MSTVSIKKATIINAIAKYSNVIIQLIINSILARILTPNEFGIVAIVMVFISFFNLLADMGIGTGIIQNKELTNKNISDIFLFTLFSGIFVSLIFFLISPIIAIFYNDVIYIKIGRIISISLFFNILNIVPNSLMLKEKRFKTIGVTTITVNTIVGVITIVAAINGASYYSLIINSIVTSMLLFLINFKNCKIKLYFNYNSKSLNIIKNYSMYQFGFNFINYFSRNLDNILIGKFIGKNSLGFYDKAYKLMLYPLQNLTFVITPVLHPILSEYQNENEIVYTYFIKVFKLLSLIGIYIGVVCFFCSREIVLILYGEMWELTIPLFKILSISIWIQMITSCSGAIFQATGKTKELFKCGVITSFITICNIFIGVSTKNLNYVSIGVVLAYFINFNVAFYILMHNVFNKHFRELLSEVKSTLLIGLIMIVFFNIIHIEINNILISIFIKGMIGTTSFLFGVFITKEYIFIKDILIKK